MFPLIKNVLMWKGGLSLGQLLPLFCWLIPYCPLPCSAPRLALSYDVHSLGIGSDFRSRQHHRWGKAVSSKVMCVHVAPLDQAGFHVPQHTLAEKQDLCR